MIKFDDIQQQIDVAKRHITKIDYLMKTADAFFSLLEKRMLDLGFTDVNIDVSNKNTGIRKIFNAKVYISAQKGSDKISLNGLEILTSIKKKDLQAVSCFINFGKNDYWGANIMFNGRSLCYDHTDGAEIRKEYKKAGSMKLIEKDYDKILNFILMPFKTFAEEKNNFKEFSEEYTKHMLKVLKNEIKKLEITDAGKKFS